MNPCTLRLAGMTLAAAILGAAPDRSFGEDRAPARVTLLTADGLELAGRYWAGRDGVKSPAVIVVGDVGEDADPDRCDAVARSLAADGCAALCFDFRGHGRSTATSELFWAEAVNQRLVRGYSRGGSKDAVTFEDFRPGYLPYLANDVAAARAFLEERNDRSECNLGQTFVVGFGRGATVGALWVATEWSRYRSYGGFREHLSATPEGQDVTGCVWVGLDPKLDRQTMPVTDWLKRAEAKQSVLIGWIYDRDDRAAVKAAERAAKELNRPKEKLFVTQGLESSFARRPAIVDQVAKFVKDIREVRDQPGWDDRDFADRRFAWSAAGVGMRLAKEEGEETLRPLPVEAFVR